MNTCPECGQPLKSAENGTLGVCLPCGYTCPTNWKPSALKLPGLDRGIQQRAIPQKESELRERIVRRLQREGYRVIQVGQGIAKRAGNSVGAADLYVSPCGQNSYRALEIKLPNYSPSSVRPEQKKLVELGESCIVTSEQEALEAMQNQGVTGRDISI